MTDPIIKNMETLENCVKIDYFRSFLGWTLSQIAYELNFNHQRMVEWLTKRSAAIASLMKADPVAVENIIKGLKKDYPAPKPEEPKKLKLDTNRVAKYLAEGKSPQEIAKSFHCNFNNFRIWFNENLKLINQKVKQMGPERVL